MQNELSQAELFRRRKAAQWALLGGIAFGGFAFSLGTVQDSRNWPFYLFLVMPLCFGVGALIGYLLQRAFGQIAS